MKKIILLLVTLFVAVVNMYSQQSTEHWIPPINSTDYGGYIGIQNITLSNTNTTDIDVYLYIGTSATPAATIAVPAGESVAYTANGINTRDGTMTVHRNDAGTIQTNKGVRLVSDEAFAADYRFAQSTVGQSDVIASKGRAGLGKLFRLGNAPFGATVASYISKLNDSFDIPQYSHGASIISTADNNTITLTGFKTGARIYGVNNFDPIPAGHVETIILQKGESYTLKQPFRYQDIASSASTWNSLLGVLVTAQENIAMNVFAIHTSVSPDQASRDYAADQIAPVSTMGYEFVLSRGRGPNASEFVVIQAHTNNTSIFLNGNTLPTATLRAGEYYVVNGGDYTNATTGYTTDRNMHIRTTNPTHCYQIVSDVGGIQPGMFFVPPIICAAPREVVIGSVDKLGPTDYEAILNIVTPSEGELFINDTPLQSFLSAGTIQNYGTSEINGRYVNGSGKYVSYQLTGSALTGNVRVRSTEDLYCGLIGAVGFANYGGYFSGFAPEINISIDEDECLPQVLDTGGGIFEEYKWYKDGALIVDATSSTYRVTTTGQYYVIGTIANCITVQSNTVVVDAVEAPTTTKPVASFCVEDNRTLLDLETDINDFTADQIAAFSTIVWYPYEIDDDNPTVVKTDRLPKNTILEGGKTYYAAILEHDGSITGTELCESVNRLAVEVVIDAIPLTPSADSYIQSFCGVPSPTVGDLQATPLQKADGSNYPLAWYDSKAGGTRLSSFTPLTDAATYYVENYDPDLFCDNTNRDSVLVDLNGPITVVKAIENKLACVGGTVTFEPVFNLTYPGEVTYKWEQKLVGETVWAAVPTTTDSDKLTYTTPALTAADHGKLIRVTASVVGCANTALSFALISVEGPVVINTQPSDVTGCVGGAATFLVDATAAQGTLSYQWFRKIEPVPPATDPTWERVGTNDASYTLSPLAISQNNSVFRVDVRTGACAYIKSSEVTLKVEGPLNFINTLPTTTAVCATKDAVFEVLASGDNIAAGDIVYTWEESLDSGATWTALDDTKPYDGQPFANTFTLTNGNKTLTKLGVTNADNGRRYRASVKSGACNGLSTTSTILNVQGAITITTHPADLTTCVGETERFEVVAVSANTDDVLQYQWYESVDTDKAATDPTLVWSPISSDAINIKSAIPAAASGNHYKVQVFTDACSFVESDIMTLKVEGPIAIISPPTMTTVCAGGDAMFITTANAGEGVPKFKWESFNTMTNAWEVEKEEAPAAGETRSTITDTLKLTSVTADYNQKLIRVSVTSAQCTRPQEATTTLNVEGPVVITTQPTDVTMCAGTTAEFDVKASGEGTLLYQWYRREKATDPWTSIGSRTATSKLSIDNVPVTLNGFQYSVGVTTAACTTEARSNAATLKTEGVVEIVTPLKDVQICDGGKTSFTVTATKGTTGTLAYEWEVSTDGGVNYNNIDMASTAPTYTLKDMNRTLELDGVTKDHSGYRYRVGVTTGKCTTPALSVATLTVDGPLVVAAPVAYSVCAGGTATFDTSVTGAGTYMYQWYRYPFNTTTGLLETTAVPIGSLSSNSKLTIDNVSPSFNKSEFYVGVTTVGCTVETKSANAALTVEGPIEIANALANQTICVGGSVTYEVTATRGAEGTLSYVWEESTDSGSTWGTAPLTNLASTATTTGYTIVDNILTLDNVQASHTGRRYRVSVTTGECKDAVTSVGRLTVEGPIEITTQPASVTVCSGDSTTFTVTATGNGTLLYQWERRQNSTAAWTTIGSRSANPDLSLDNINSNLNKFQFRVGVTTGACAVVYSDPATLFVEGPIIITSRFSDQLACPTEDVSYKVLASSGTAGQGTLIYKWEEYNPATMAWSEVTDAYAAANRIEFKRQDPTDMTSAKITLVKKAIVTSDDGNRYRVSLTTGACTFAEVVEAGLSVTGAITITTQPVDVATCVDTRVEFLVAGTSATGSNVSYQWEEKLKDETDWNDIGGATSARFVISPTQAYMDGAQYRAKLSSGECSGTTSNAVTLTVDGPLEITDPLENTTICAGNNVSFTLEATAGAATLEYLWYESTDGVNFGTALDPMNPPAGMTISGKTLTKTNVAATDDGKYYKVSVKTAQCTKKESVAKLTVEGPISIDQQPVSVSVCSGTPGTFEVAASTTSTSGVLQYQWEEKPSGSTVWRKIPGAIANVYSKAFTRNVDNATQYRVKVSTGACAEMISDEVTLTVEGAIAFDSVLTDVVICAGTDAVYSVDVSNEGQGTLAYKWEEYDGTDWNEIDQNDATDNFTFNTAANELTKTNVASTDDDNRYRVSVTTGACTTPIFSTASLSVDGPLTIDTEPTDFTACAGNAASFSVEASSESGEVTYLWEESSDNGANWRIVGTLSSFIKSPVRALNSGYQYRVHVNNGVCDEYISDPVTLTVEGPLTVTPDLSDVTICAGGTATYTAVANNDGSGTVSYTWHVSTNGGVSWTPLTETSNTYTKTNVTAADDENLYRVTVATGNCSAEAITSTAKLNVDGPINIIAQPTDKTVCAGSVASFSVDATTGTGILSYSWEESADGATWNEVATGRTYVVIADAAKDGYQYRVKLNTGVCTEVISDSATLTVEGPVSITRELEDVTLCAGDTATFAAIVTNGSSGTVNYTWHESTNGGVSWTPLAETSNTYTKTNVTSSDDNKLYRVTVATGNCLSKAITSTAKLNVDGPINIIAQPTDKTVCAESVASFSIDATTDTGILSYLWEESADGTTWNEVAIGKTYIVFADAAKDGYQYRVKLNTGVCTEVVSDPATLTVEGPITITRELENAISCVGGDVTYTVLVTNDASGTINYMWEESVDGGFNWSTIAGETTNTYTKLGVTANDSENRYRVTASLDACTSTLSSIATLKVEGPLVIVDDIVDAEVCVGDTAFFSPTLQDSPTTEFQYIWESSTDGGSTWTVISRLAAISVNNAQLEDNGTLYRVRIYSAGCTEIVSNTAMLFVQSLASIYEDPEDLEVKAGEDAMFMVTLESEFGDYTYQWQVNDTSDSGWVNLSDNGVYSGTTERVLSITGVSLSMDENKYRVLVTSCNGTVISDHALLTINNDIFPNYFSPNGDGINDTFVVPYLRDYPNFTMKIYDRWGNYLYEVADDGDVTTEPDWWNGISDGQLNYQDGELLPAGTYFYIIHYDLEDKKAPKTGWVYLRR